MPQTDTTEIGEDALIAEFLAPLAAGVPGAFGLRDDCASLTPAPGMDLVVKTDPVRAGVHFFADDDPADIAWKALAVNVSDLAAKGATPLVYLLAISFPAAPTRAWITKFCDGLREAQAVFGCRLTGGDTDRAPGPLSIAVTVIGTVPTGCMVPRGGAKIGDGIYVSGSIGGAALGLALRGDSKTAAGWRVSPVERKALVDRYLRPQPRLALATALRAHASAAMDVSDGLAKDADRMLRAGGVGGDVDVGRVPLSAVARRLCGGDHDLLARLVTGGDDYEVLCTIAPTAETAFVRDAQRAAIPVTRIGTVGTGSGARFVGPDGAPMALERLGWTHF